MECDWEVGNIFIKTIIILSLVMSANGLAAGSEPRFDVRVEVPLDFEDIVQGQQSVPVDVEITCVEWSPIMSKDSMVFTPFVVKHVGPDDVESTVRGGKFSKIFTVDDCFNNVPKHHRFEVVIDSGAFTPGLAPVWLEVGVEPDQGTGNGSATLWANTSLTGRPSFTVWANPSQKADDAFAEIRVSNRANVAIVGSIMRNTSSHEGILFDNVSVGPISSEHGFNIEWVGVPLEVDNRLIGSGQSHRLVLDIALAPVGHPDKAFPVETVFKDITFVADQEEAPSTSWTVFVLLCVVLLVAVRIRRRTS